MTKLNWEKSNKRTNFYDTKPRKKGFGGKNKLEIYFKFRKKNEIERKAMNDLLEKEGWKVCPQCGGGRHPAFSLCKKCKSRTAINSIP